MKINHDHVVFLIQARNVMLMVVLLGSMIG